MSFFVLPDYRPPVAACAMNEILALISSEAPSIQPILIVPFITRPSGCFHGMVNATKTGQLTTLHAAEIGASNEFTHLLVDGSIKPPPSLQIRSEPIQCLLEIVRVLKIPTVLVTSGGQHQGKSSSDSDLEVQLPFPFLYFLIIFYWSFMESNGTSYRIKETGNCYGNFSGKFKSYFILGCSREKLTCGLLP